LGVARFAEISKSIVGAIAVDVINLDRPATVMQQERYAMRSVGAPVHNDFDKPVVLVSSRALFQ
jgi:hypothetical protein